MFTMSIQFEKVYYKQVIYLLMVYDKKENITIPVKAFVEYDRCESTMKEIEKSRPDCEISIINIELEEYYKKEVSKKQKKEVKAL